MKRLVTAIPIVAATMLLSGCGSVDGVGFESVAAGGTGGASVQERRALPHWHPPLQQDQAPPMRGPMRLPPGHPAVPESLAICPGGGVARESEGYRPGDLEADPRAFISI